MADIKHQITINAPARKIYGLIATKAGIEKWLTKEDGWKITGQENVGGVLLFYFGENHHEMKISKLDPDKEVKWECTVGHPEWVGTTVDFSIEVKEDKCILHFAHQGWANKTKFFEQCNQVWEGNISDIKELAEG
jgi:uncharacterized protein YndB with AHSA1/START domain